MISYESLAAEIGRLVDAKQAAYGNSFGKSGEFLALLWPQGVPPETYHLALAFVRMFDKMMRMATNPTAFGEDPARDLVGYALLLVGATVPPTGPSGPLAATQQPQSPGKPFSAVLPKAYTEYLKYKHGADCPLYKNHHGTCTCDPSPGA